MSNSFSQTAHLLIVSSNPAVLESLGSMAGLNSWQIETAMNPARAIERLQSGVRPQLLLLDVTHGNLDCEHLLQWMHRLHPDPRIIIMCSTEDESTKRAAMSLGVRDAVIGPMDQARLKSIIDRYHVGEEASVPTITSEDIEQVGPDLFFVSASPITHKLRAQAKLVADTDIPALIVGESGSGKETVARLIHKLSVRSGFPFLKVDCANMPADLLDTELFGVKQGDNPANSNGKLKRANKGTLLLHEITEMPLALQCRLMDALNNNTVTGRKEPGDTFVDVRVLATSSADVDRAVAEGKLREDLYCRLTAFTIQVPPVRQRRSEITILLQHSMHQLAKHYGLPARIFSPRLLGACQAHAWPGNLSELESFVKRYLLAGDENLSFESTEPRANGVSSNQLSASWVGVSRAAGPDTDDMRVPTSLKLLVHRVTWEAERNAIWTALKQTQWNRKAAARLLQVSYRTMLYKIDRYHLVPPDHSDAGTSAAYYSKG